MEFSDACVHGCCPTSLLNFPNHQNATTKPSSTCAASRRDFAATTSSSIFPGTYFTNHDSLPSLQESFAVFTKAYPQYQSTSEVDQIRAREYYHLALSKQTCLDYIGIGLFSYSQLQREVFSRNSIASSSSSSLPQQNPSPPRNLHFPFFGVSCKTGSLKAQLLSNHDESEVEAAIKRRIFRFLNISETDYSMVFTANRTSAFKLLAESYPFQTNKKLLTVYDYESEAVETMISSSEKRGAQAMSAEFSWPRLRIHSAKLREMLVCKRKTKTKRGLFVFPVHSRVTGARYPYLWMTIAQENSWHVLIDACALGPKDMDSFGLSLFQPDFLVCSFYKVFGENPSGFGCLFVKKTTISILEPSPSGAGIVKLVPEEKLFQLPEDSSVSAKTLGQLAAVHPKGNTVSPSSSFSGPISSQTMSLERLEQEELSLHHEVEATPEQDDLEHCKTEKPGSSVSLSINGNGDGFSKRKLELQCRCLDQVDSLGLVMVAKRARCLINWLVSSLMKLKHPNTDGVSLVRIYGPKIKFDRGQALAFNIFDWKGEKVEPVLVQKLADRNNVSLSYGFLHRIWFSDKYSEEKGRVLEKREKFGTNKKRAGSGLGVSVVTIALGFLSNFEDTYKLWAFVAQFLDADYVEKERWRYTALNQKTVEV